MPTVPKDGGHAPVVIEGQFSLTQSRPGPLGHELHDFLRLIRLAGVPFIRIHDVRHTYATLALEGGANLIGLARQLGHARPSITSDIYAHVTAPMQQQVTDTVDCLLFGERLPVANRGR